MTLPQRIMIFGRPGSGKSTYAVWLSQTLNLPIYHLDKYFFVSEWGKQDDTTFMRIQKEIADQERWVIDGNSTRSLEIRWARADCVLYFNVPRFICYARVLKRYFRPNSFDDRAPGCDEKMRWSLLEYMWSFEKRVEQCIPMLKNKYPGVTFDEIRNESDLNRQKIAILSQLEIY